MKKEDFVALGISEELAEKAAAALEEEMKGLVPKSRLNEEIQKKKNAEQSYNDIKEELDKLKSFSGDNETLQKQIKALQDELQTKETGYANEIADLKMTNAIIASIGSTAQDADIVAGLLDRSKLTLSEDGNLSGLEEQMKGLLESKPFLFKPGSTYPEVEDKGEQGHQGGGTAREQFANWFNQN